MLDNLSFNKRMIIDATWKGLLAGEIILLEGLVLTAILVR